MSSPRLEKAKKRKLDKAHSDEIPASPVDLNQAFMDLYLYAADNSLGGFIDCYDIETKRSNIEVWLEDYFDLCSEIISKFSSSEELNKIYEEESDIRDQLNSLHSIINSLIEPEDSCGSVANRIVELFVGQDEGENLKFTRDTRARNIFTQLTNENEDELLARMISVSNCGIARIEICKGNEYTTTHSYCLLFTQSPAENYYVYQAYFGQYSLAVNLHPNRAI